MKTERSMIGRDEIDSVENRSGQTNKFSVMNCAELRLGDENCNSKGSVVPFSESPRKNLKETIKSKCKVPFQHSMKDKCKRKSGKLKMNESSSSETKRVLDKGILSVKDQQEILMNDAKLSQMNALEVIQNELIPKDLFPNILSFAGPSAVSALSLTSKSWNKRVKDESVWKVLSKDMDKWREGDEIPKSWLKFYRRNPCVPVDYKTIESAMKAVSEPCSNMSMDKRYNIQYAQKENARILLHPGMYVLSNPIVIRALDSATVTIETVRKRSKSNTQGFDFVSQNNVTESISQNSDEEMNTNRSSLIKSCLTSSARRHLSPFIRSICRSDSNSGIPRTNARDTSVEIFEAELMNQLYNQSSSFYFNQPATRALIVFKSPRLNTPAVHILEGETHLKRVDFFHECEGTDIWNGNSAIQIQPYLDENNNPPRFVSESARPCCHLTESDVTSCSGRGVVAIDGGHLLANRCFIHNCAATGIYIGGSGSSAGVNQSDITNNGHGNESRSRGIARGHSGVYLEQGAASLVECNISNNSLTGISAISPDNAILVVKDSDIVRNGSTPIELPQTGSESWKKSSIDNNNNYSTLSSNEAGRSGLAEHDLSELDDSESEQSQSSDDESASTMSTDE
eukprot:CAMPEP_0178943048 /NCGR_PEP_ID=MMETSP0789-20121207/2349_1 /TAXON_ID=3005 /ORGANISM="Rhizosolenia setigera, Strain CCMP 1694" /LENGTH=626 /DNA_ID=CAMNT_0020622557 /DNA_START=1610 /DNA_END=3490 /DNA_ORIENTATION=-